MAETSYNFIFCTECGKKLSSKASVCPSCGCPKQPTRQTFNSSTDSNKFILVLLLCWFLGVFGVHRFYSGHITIGVIQLLTAGGCGIWTIFDLIMIATGNYTDSDGNPIRYS